MCVLNGSTTTEYFLLERGTHQGDPISALEILFHLMKLRPKIHGLLISDHCYLTSEIVGVEVLRRVQGVICSMCCLDLNNDTTKILSTQFCYNEKLKKEKT